ncbi:ThuA domain-containing protein [Streptomyces sp. NPDC086838]|uniref:ThuA domain-containing protein n=1 Tax=Streptomyces sp. NPDC086838 TaxID=3365762 RepID=UPI003808BA4C
MRVRHGTALLLRLLALAALVLGLQAAPAHAAPAAGTFRVLAFYDGTYDAAHISFDHEANTWFAQQGAAHGFTYTATTDWSRLNSTELAGYQVVMFLDNYPHTASQRSAFQSYVQNGGGFVGFHVSAFNTDTSDWPWYHNTFLGTGTFRSNTWGPTQETLRVDDPGHPAAAGLPATITSSVSEWYSWQNDLRKNPAIDVLASMDPSTFPIGTDPNQTWYSGDYPIVWSNRDYRMVYNNFGHNAMDYATDTALSSTFASAQQNRLLLQEIAWAAGQDGGPVTPPDGTAGRITGYGGKCVDIAGASTANGAAVQLYDCNGSGAQVWQHRSSGELFNPASGKCLDATGPSSANGTRLQIWTCYAAANQQWTLPA